MAGNPKTLMPRPKSVLRNKNPLRLFRGVPIAALLCVFTLSIGFFSLPSILSLDLALEEQSAAGNPFPVSVDPERRLIVTDPAIEAMLEEEPTSLTASVGTFGWLFNWMAITVSELPLYTLVAGADHKFVVIHPGYREEEVARAFGNALNWGPKQRSAFLKQVYTNPPVLNEGQFQPGTYEVSKLMTTDQIQIMIYDRFSKEILERYSTTTAEQVPLEDALTIASLIEREAAGWEDMRDISGILWNRIFLGMNLQIDATLQYAKATGKDGNWWPKPVPKDKYIKSKFNTYKYPGLPPTPISSPSVAAVVAALNPKKTDCIFYFHDANGVFHCSPTYEGHVKLLKKYYGQGK